MTRRQMVAALGAAASLEAQPKAAGVGVIGLGLRSRAHLGALEKLRSESSITALCDIQPDRMAAVNSGLPAKAATYTDYRELIKDPKVGIVVVVTPGYLHHEMAMAALRAGKDLLLEKPLSLNYADAVDIVREARRTGRIVCVGMQRRYSRSDAQVLKLVGSGAIGPIKFINYEEYRGDWNPHSWKYTDPATGKQASWRTMSKTAGSSELEFSIHALAMVTSLVRSPLKRLSATGGVVHYKDRDTRDLSAILVEFADGARLSYSFNCFSPRAGGKLLIVGDRGVIRREGSKLLMSAGDKPLEAVENSEEAEGGAEVQMYREFFRDVRERKASPLSPEEALEPSKIAFGAEMAISGNRVVTAADFPAV